VKYRPLKLGDGTATTMIFGAATQTPFGTVSRRDKHLIGAAIKKLAGA
jgi:hypothetical protein